MRQSQRLLLIGFASVGAMILTALPVVAQQKPNVVFILADNVS